MQYLTACWQFDSTRFRDLSWWHWLVTAALLGAYVTTWEPVLLYAAIVLCALTANVYAVHHRSWRPWPVQIRVGFLVLLVLGCLPGMWWVYFSQLCGVSALLTVGYCPMHRMLLLLPWNRRQPLTWDYSVATMCAAPGSGGVMRYSGTPQVQPVCS